MASGRFQETRGRWETVPNTSVEKVTLTDGTSLKDTLDTLTTEFSEGITLTTSGVEAQSSAAITIEESDNCSLVSIVVLMGGSNITSSVWNSTTKTISVANVTDDIVIKISTSSVSTSLLNVIVNNVDETEEYVTYDKVNDAWVVTFPVQNS